ncbi:MAG: 23S rRNA (uracil(1939)-C(5))-methyltransferase RlmD [Bacteroidetes bacterium]|nr:MAG: 23S rRNA (uracil(1939)-C(5))-methyltransferase RlmD [Bacteroidota bacterium]
MARKKRPLPFIENLEVMDAGAEGKAVARYNERVVFIPFAAPGDLVDVQVYKKRRNYYEARIEKLHKASEYRVQPKCSHFGLCGGCKWQHLDYEAQKRFKQKQVKDSLDRIAKVPYPEVLPIIGADKIYYYRNKLEFTFSDRRWLTDLDASKEEGGPTNTNGLGFHLPGMFDKILDIEQCYLQADPSNDIRLAVKQYALDNGLTFFNARSQEGLLRNMIIRNAVSGDLMVIVIFKYNDKKVIEGLMHFLSKKFPEITSLMYVINEKLNDSITDQEPVLFKGEPYIMEEMPSPVKDGNAFKFKVGPLSFYQTNPEQAFKLYKTAYDFASFKGNELVYDLYTGTGTIASFVARAVNKVIGIEYVEDAVADAKQNMALNNIENIEFYWGDMAKVLDDAFITAHGKPDVLLTDPPRAGMHEKVVRQILAMEPEKIVYVSCNPATQARDVALLHEKYDIVKVQPVDMFPQTHHVENVILLHKR